MAKKLTTTGIFVLFALCLFPTNGLTDWKVYYTGKAAGMFGSYGRGSFATKTQCESYRVSRPGLERNNSYCSGYDTASSKPVNQDKKTGDKPGPAQGMVQQALPPKPVTTGESQFARDKEELLGTMKIPAPDETLQPGGTAFFASGGRNTSPEAGKEQEEFEKDYALWVKKQKQLIEERTKRSNRYVPEIYKSLKSKAPPPLPPRKYDELQPGDVILISRDDSYSSFFINLGDRLTTDLKSPASHTVLFLKTVNGKKLFLDHTPGRGSHVIDEDEFLRLYGSREMLAASPRVAVAQPVKEAQTRAIWQNAKKLLANEENRTGNIIDQTGYGLYGNDNMVCSEASRWVLVKSGRDIPESASPLKRILGIHYGPANFFADDYNFIITPLWGPAQK